MFISPWSAASTGQRPVSTRLAPPDVAVRPSEALSPPPPRPAPSPCPGQAHGQATPKAEDAGCSGRRSGRPAPRGLRGVPFACSRVFSFGLFFLLFKKNSTFVFRALHTPGTSAGQGSRASASGPGPPASGRGGPASAGRPAAAARTASRAAARPRV